MAGFLDVLNQAIGGVGNLVGGVGNIVGGVENILKKLGISPQTAAGLGLTAAGASQAGLPGYATDAVQFLRNQFTSPTALSEDLTGQLQGLADRFQPLLTQQRQLDLGDIQQRFAAAFPTSVGAQPSEFKGLADYITRTALPREQGLLTNLGLGLVERQSRSAEDLLNFAKPNPLGAALGQLGGLLTVGDMLRGGGVGGNVGGVTLPASQFPSWLTTAVQTIGQLVGSRVSGGSPNGEGGFDLKDSLGQTIATILADGTVINSRTGEPIWKLPQTQSPTTSPEGFPRADLSQPHQADMFQPSQPQTGLTRTSFDPQGLLTALQGLGGVSTPPTGEGAPGASRIPGLIGTSVGALAGRAIGGALAGAEGGSLIPGVGTAIGALAGFLTGGAIAGSAAHKAQKEFFRRQDLDSQADQVQEIGSFFTRALSALNVDTTAFQQFVSQKIAESPGPGDEQSMVAAEGGKLLLQAIQKSFPQVQSLNDVPGLRAQYVDFLIRNTFSAGNSIYGGGPALNAIEGGFSTAAGFS